MKLLLISNSTNAGEEYLRYPLAEIGRFLQGVREIAFVPYAAVTFSPTPITKKRCRPVSRSWGSAYGRSTGRKDPAAFIRKAGAVCVGGGNTFALARKMQQQGLMTAILRKIKAGTPYVGWSAGSNVCCPTICTTNDMPIVEPESFRAIGAVKFQITPPLPRRQPRGTRRGDPRTAHPRVHRGQPRRWVVGLREGCMLHYDQGRLELIGKRPMRIFKKGIAPYEVQPGDDLSFLL